MPGLAFTHSIISGSFEHYSHITYQNQQGYSQPIYIGKAVPKGWRTGRIAHTDQDKRLYERLEEHTGFISNVENLEVHDFHCRFMILNGVEMDLISAVESTLIRTYKPLWNTVVDGFGNHDPGSRRYNQARSKWDVLHPGRIWADRLTGPVPQLEEIIAEIGEHHRRISSARAFVVLPQLHRVGGCLWPWRLVHRTE